MSEKLAYYGGQLKKMMSNDDFPKYLPDSASKIMLYRDLKKYNTIDDLLPNDFDYRIILIETKRGEGHWMSLVKKDGCIYFNDSYGMTFSEELTMIPMFVRRMLGQENDEIRRLAKNALNKYEVFINPYQFQEDVPNVNTCGRWVCFFIKCLEEGFSYDEMSKKVETQELKQGKPSDILVIDWFP